MKMLLSSETRLGIRITGIHTVLIILFMQETLILCFIHVVNSFIELVEYIFNNNNNNNNFTVSKLGNRQIKVK